MSKLQPTDQPDVRPLPGPWWAPRLEVVTSWTVPPEVAVWPDGGYIKVPAGFRSDGSSEWLVSVVLGFLPAFVLWVFGIRADGPHRAAWVAHDFISRSKRVPRVFGDRVFLRLLRRGGDPDWRSMPRYWVVRGYSMVLGALDAVRGLWGGNKQ